MSQKCPKNGLKWGPRLIAAARRAMGLIFFMICVNFRRLFNKLTSLGGP